MTPVHRADGWHLLGDMGEDVGPFPTLEAAQEFLDWNENRLAAVPQENNNAGEYDPEPSGSSGDRD